MSKIAQITKFMEGTQIMGDGLKMYHDCKAALKANYGKRSLIERCGVVKSALRHYRVIVSIDAHDCVRIYRPDMNKEFFI